MKQHMNETIPSSYKLNFASHHVHFPSKHSSSLGEWPMKTGDLQLLKSKQFVGSIIRGRSLARKVSRSDRKGAA